MTERDKQLAIIRTEAGIAQQELREKAEDAITRSLKDVDIEALYQSVTRKKREARILVEWIDKMMTAGDTFAPPEECHTLARWIIRNPQLATGGYNPQLLKLARIAAREVEGTGFRKRLENIAGTLSKKVTKWAGETK